MRAVKRGNRLAVALILLVVCGFLAGCPSGGSAKKLDGVYHAAQSPVVITLKDGKATVTVGNESQTLDYKVEGTKLTIVNPKEGDAVFTINDDGTLSGPFGTFSKTAT